MINTKEINIYNHMKPLAPFNDSLLSSLSDEDKIRCAVSYATTLDFDSAIIRHIENASNTHKMHLVDDFLKNPEDTRPSILYFNFIDE